MPRSSRPHNQPLPDAVTLIRALRLARGWSQEALGQRVFWNGGPVTRQTIDKWEKDQQGLNLGKLAAVAAAFGLSIRDVLPRRADEMPEDPILPITPEERRVIEWMRRGPRERMLALGMSAQINEGQAADFIHRPTSQAR